MYEVHRNSGRGWLYESEEAQNPVAILEDPELAERIAACLNACAGIETQELEGHGFAKLDDDPLYELVRA